MKCDCGYEAPNVNEAREQLWLGHTKREHGAYVGGHIDGVVSVVEHENGDLLRHQHELNAAAGAEAERYRKALVEIRDAMSGWVEGDVATLSPKEIHALAVDALALALTEPRRSADKAPIDRKDEESS